MGQKISLDAAGAELGASKSTVRRLISSGKLPAYRVGKTTMVRVDRDDLTKYCGRSSPTASTERLRRPHKKWPAVLC
jgi:excisionase family DNA binding protein